MYLIRKRCLFTNLTAATLIATVFPLILYFKLFHALQLQINDLLFRSTKLYFDVSPEKTIIKV